MALGGQISNSVVRVDYTEFVRLTVKYANQVAGDGRIVVYFLTPFDTALKFGVLAYCVRSVLYVFTKQKLNGELFNSNS